MSSVSSATPPSPRALLQVTYLLISDCLRNTCVMNISAVMKWFIIITTVHHRHFSGIHFTAAEHFHIPGKIFVRGHRWLYLKRKQHPFLFQNQIYFNALFCPYIVKIWFSRLICHRHRGHFVDQFLIISVFLKTIQANPKFTTACKIVICQPCRIKLGAVFFLIFNSVEMHVHIAFSWSENNRISCNAVLSEPDIELVIFHFKFIQRTALLKDTVNNLQLLFRGPCLPILAICNLIFLFVFIC